MQKSPEERGNFLKRKSTAYPNFFHPVRTLTDFEYKEFPKTVRTKKKRVSKIRCLALELAEVLSSDLQPHISSGRIEVSLQGEPADSDLLGYARFVALSQFKKISMRLLPVSEIVSQLNRVIQHEDYVGSDHDALTPKNKAELAILCNMCGLWSYSFKKFLSKSLDDLDEEHPSEAGSVFSLLKADEKVEILSQFVSTHSRSVQKFKFRTWTSKGGRRRKGKGPPISNGTGLGFRV
jgi:hypothetical protein